MKSKIFWTVALLAVVALAVNSAPDLRRYYKISSM
jgi:hypothetical protein